MKEGKKHQKTAKIEQNMRSQCWSTQTRDGQSSNWKEMDLMMEATL
jgi:hypothetical protein